MLSTIFGPPDSFFPHEPSVRHAISAGLRDPVNYGFPIIVTFLLIGISVGAFFLPVDFFVSLPFRIIFYDYFIFFIVWFDAFSNAQRWRAKRECLEELSLTRIPPSVTGEVLFAPTITIWYRCFLVLACVEIGLSGYSHYQAIGNGYPFMMAMLSFPLFALVYLLLARFHAESIRIAYWVFSPTALPGVPLFGYLAYTVLYMAVIVFTLTVMGSMIAGAIFIASIFSVFILELGIGGTGNLRFDGFRNPTDLGYLPGAILGLVIVAAMKRSVSRTLSYGFSRQLLMASWWGLADTNHPKSYPPNYNEAARAFIIAEKESIRNDRESVI